MIFKNFKLLVLESEKKSKQFSFEIWTFYYIFTQSPSPKKDLNSLKSNILAVVWDTWRYY